MIVMLSHLYGIHYENVWNDHIQDPCLVFHAGTYVVAEKYQVQKNQVPKLKEEAYENFHRILGPKPRWHEYDKRPLREYNFIDFPVALHMIYAGTKPESKVRPLMTHACTASLDKLEENPNFWTLLEQLPDLAVEIIKHPSLAGDWDCDGEKYTVWGPRECEGVPACPNCGIDDGVHFADPREPYE